MSENEHLAVRIGDHSGGPARDTAPGTETVTFYNADGTVWRTFDADTRVTEGIREIAAQEQVDPDVLISLAFAEGFARCLEKWRREE